MTTPNALTFDAAAGRIAPARFVPSPNCDRRPAGARIEVLVIHAISLPPGQYGGDAIERLFTNRLPTGEGAHPCFAQLRDLRVSAHFLIRRDGALVQFVPTHLRAWHAGESSFRGRARVNDFSLGIELEGCDEDAFEDAQYRTLARLARCLMAHHAGLSPQRMVGHSDIAPRRKTDPGPHFDWARLRGLVGDAALEDGAASDSALC